MEGKMDPPPRLGTRQQRRALRRRTVKGGKLRAPPSSKKARLMHSLMTAVFLAAGLVVIGLLRRALRWCVGARWRERACACVSWMGCWG